MRERKQQNIWKQMDAIHAECGLKTAAPGFTVTEYAERYGMTRRGAGERLAALVRSGKLIADFRLERGHRVRVFRLIEE